MGRSCGPRDSPADRMWHTAELIYLMLPVYAANMAAPFARLLPGTPRPISERRLGAHKTWRGCVLALGAATAVALVQSRIAWPHNLIRYDDALALGLASGAAAMVGDGVKSYFKRRKGIAPGQAWIPADQLDHVVAGMLVLSTRFAFSLADIVTILAFSFIASLAMNRLSAKLRIKETPW